MATSRFTSSSVGEAIASPRGLLIALPALVILLAVVLIFAAKLAMEHTVRNLVQQQFAQHVASVTTAVERSAREAPALMNELDHWARVHAQPFEREDLAGFMHALLAQRSGIARLEFVEHADGQRRIFRYEDRGLHPSSVHLDDDYNPTERPYWQRALQTPGELVWTSPYLFFDGVVGITAARSLHAEDGSLRGVFTVDFSLNSIGTLVNELSQQTGDTIFIVDSDGHLLAWPGLVETSDPASAPADDLPRIESIGDEAALTLLATREMDGPAVRFDTADGERYVGSMRNYAVSDDLNLVIAAYAPLELFLASSRGFWRQAWIIAIVGTLLAIGCSVFLALYVNRSRRVVARAREQAAEAHAAVREFGSYELVRQLGHGGMGEVWIGEHRMLARPAAIKLILPERLAGRSEQQVRETLERFEREARATAQLRSRNTVELYDFGISDDGSFYQVMELLDGLDLAELVANEGAQPLGRVVHLGIQICNSLAEAHDQGLIHRDIKPANIYCCQQADEGDVVKVLDFGMVLSQGEPEDARLTDAGSVNGTPAYMAPEQARGEKLDGKTDVYAIGCVLYHLVTGDDVFHESTVMALMMAHVSKDAPPPSSRVEREIPAAWDDLILRCLDKQRTDRPDVRELRSALLGLPIPVGEEWDFAAIRQWWLQFSAARAACTEVPAECARRWLGCRGKLSKADIDPLAATETSAQSVVVVGARGQS